MGIGIAMGLRGRPRTRAMACTKLLGCHCLYVSRDEITEQVQADTPSAVLVTVFTVPVEEGSSAATSAATVWATRIYSGLVKDSEVQLKPDESPRMLQTGLSGTEVDAAELSRGSE